MSNFLLYNLSPKILTSLSEIKKTREKILCSIIAPDEELKLRWDSRLSSIYWSLKIGGTDITKNQIVKILTTLQYEKSKSLSNDQKEAVDYKHALDHIAQNWYITPKKITPDTISELYLISAKSATKDKSLIKFKQNESDIKYFLDYLQSGEENPIIQAAIAQIQLKKISPFNNLNGRMSRLTNQLILYKYGYDFRGMLNLDEYWGGDWANYKKTVTSTESSGNLTPWLEYYTNAMVVQLAKSLNKIQVPRKLTWVNQSSILLNSRQKNIAILLEDPEMKITNKDVQHKFKISQLTASRDLAKLTALGILTRRGKGRSVYYIKL